MATTVSVRPSTPVSNQSSPDDYTEMWKKLWAARDIAWHLNKRNP